MSSSVLKTGEKRRGRTFLEECPFQDLATAFTDFYEERLKTLGYPHVARSLDVMKNSRNVHLYPAAPRRLAIRAPRTSLKRFLKSARSANGVYSDGRKEKSKIEVRPRRAALGSAPLARMPAELLQEERHALLCALIAQFAEPIEGGRSGAWLTLSTSDPPVDTADTIGPRESSKGSADTNRTAASTRRR